MDPDGFVVALGNFPVTLRGDSVESLVDLWNGEMVKAINLIASKHLLPRSRAKLAVWFSGELVEMKKVGNRFKRQWHKTQSESDQT